VPPNPIKLANLWRIIREIDLQAIRQQAIAPFDLLIVAGDAPDARRLQDVLTGGGTGAAFVRTAAAEDAAAVATPTATIAVTGTLPLPSTLETAVYALRKAHVPVAIVHVAPAGSAAAAKAGDAAAASTAGHVTVAAIDAAAAPAIAAALLPLVHEEQRLALAHRLPPFRPAFAELTIDETARANATYALTTGLAESIPVLTAPLNLGDMVILTKNQLLMSYRLVLAAGRDGDPKRLIAEILGVLGGGLLFRQLARQLVGLIPVAGLVPKIAIAYGGTWAIGRAVLAWTSDGRPPGEDALRSLGRDGLERGREVARDLVSRARTQAGGAAARWERFRAQLPGLRRSRPRLPPPPAS
jgi:uncharacterized protein (DUF697 family)